MFENSSELIFIILTAIAFFQGSILLIALLKNSKDKDNFYMVGIIFFVMWLLLEFLFIRNKININLNLFYASRFGSWLLLGPLFYLYSKRLLLVNSKKQFQVLHFLPFLLFTIILPFFFAKPLSSHSIDYGMLSLFRYDFPNITWIQHFYTYLFILQFLHVLVYLILSIKNFRNVSLTFKENYSNMSNIYIKWLKLLSVAIGIIIIFTLLYYSILLDKPYYRRHMDYIYMLPMVLLVYFIAYIALRKPLLFHDKENLLPIKKKYDQSNLELSTALSYKEEIIKVMKDKKLYQKPDLKLSDLAESLEISPKHLSQTINEQFSKSFYDLINYYRIEDAKAKLLDPENDLSIIQIAYDVGFNNKTSFNNYFKKLTKLTPKAFRLKKEKMN